VRSGRPAILMLVSLTTLFAQTKFTAAKITHGELTLFPSTGSPLKIDLPKSVRTAQVVRTYGDGKSIYTTTSLAAPQGITKIEFNPVRESIVPGSETFLRVSFLTTMPDGNLRVSGCRKDLEQAACGVFEIDPASGKARLIASLVAQRQYRDISPDGKRALVYDGDVIKREPLRAGVVDLASGIAQPLKGVESGSWSPDGRWLVVLRKKHLELLDSNTLIPIRSLGAAKSMGIWSPDSKLILSVRSRISCSLTLYGESLSVLDVEKGERKLIDSSRCQWAGGPITWIDAASVQ
jgi:hypothetical protein